jgi:hypothetical protein
MGMRQFYRSLILLSIKRKFISLLSKINLERIIVLTCIVTTGASRHVVAFKGLSLKERNMRGQSVTLSFANICSSSYLPRPRC